jgi:hypothetical protein
LRSIDHSHQWPPFNDWRLKEKEPTKL